eukprot:5399959-Amphidinium_carterae.3
MSHLMTAQAGSLFSPSVSRRLHFQRIDPEGHPAGISLRHWQGRIPTRVTLPCLPVRGSSATLAGTTGALHSAHWYDSPPPRRSPCCTWPSSLTDPPQTALTPRFRGGGKSRPRRADKEPTSGTPSEPSVGQYLLWAKEAAPHYTPAQAKVLLNNPKVRETFAKQTDHQQRAAASAYEAKRIGITPKLGPASQRSEPAARPQRERAARPTQELPQEELALAPNQLISSGNYMFRSVKP